MPAWILRARKCVTLSVAVVLAVGLMSVPASAQADEDKGLSSGALAVLLIGRAGAQTKFGTYARMPRPYAGKFAGSSLPPVRAFSGSPSFRRPR
jgi:hypothetical protein